MDKDLTMAAGNHDVTGILMSLLEKLEGSVSALTREVHELGAELRDSRKDYLSLNARITSLETWRTKVDDELRDIKPVSEVVDKIKKWAITGVALGVVGLLLLVVAMLGWVKFH